MTTRARGGDSCTGEGCMCVVVGDDNSGGNADNDDGFTVLNLSNSSKMLPPRVVFKEQGQNGRYLSARQINNQLFLQFASADKADPTVLLSIENRNNGVALIRSAMYHPGYWVLQRTSNSSPTGWIRPLGSNSNADPFLVIMVNNDYIALRYNRESMIYLCRSRTADGVTRCLGVDGASTGALTADARIVVEEAIVSREIYSISYNLREARVYDTNVVAMAATSAANDTSAVNTKRLRLIYEEEETSTWDATAELKLGYKSSLRAGFPKLGLGATVSISAEFFGAYNWGETIHKKVKHEVEYEVAVPPMSKVTVRLLAARSAVDVPFTYQQRDVRVTGETSVTTKRDGLFTGINSYNFDFEVVEEKLPERSKFVAMAS